LPAFALASCSCEGGGGLGVVEPDLQVTPARLDFGDVPLGESLERSLILKNAGAGALEIARTKLEDATGGYSLPGARISVIGASGQNELRVVFLPTALGDAPATLTLESNDKDSPTIVQITGKGVRRSFDAIPQGGPCGNTADSISFGQGVIGTSVERQFSLQATGSVPVTLRGARIENVTSGEWSLDAPAAGTIIAPGSPLLVSGRFTAVDVGEENATFVFSTDAGDDIRITACARGIVAEICIAPVPLDFGQVVINRTTTASVTIENCGGRSLTITRAQLAGDADPAFTSLLPNAAPFSLTPGARLSVPLHFAPTELGVRNTVLEIDSDAAGSDPRVPVLAEGVEDCSVSVLPGIIDYGVVAFGTALVRPALVTNDSRKSCTVHALTVTATAGFSLKNPPAVPFTLAPGEGIVVDVEYMAPMRGRVDRGLMIARAGRGPHVARLAANVPTSRGCQLEVDPPSINFGTTAPRVLTRQSTNITNISSDACNILSTSLDPRSGPGFGDESNANGPIPPGGSRTLTVTYFPFGTGRAGAILSVLTDDADTPLHEVVVSAFVPPPGICVDPLHIPFGDQPGVTTRDFRVWACGTRAVQLTDLAFTSPDPEFSLQNFPQLPVTLQPGDERMVTVRFEPTDAIGDTAVIAVGSDDPATPIIFVNVTGGAEIVPPSAGRFLWYWRIQSMSGSGSDIMRLPLQGAPVAAPYWGSHTGQSCAGCHSISPDGRYLAVVDDQSFSIEVIDTQIDQRVTLPFRSTNTLFVSWNPNVNTNPPYQFVYDDNDDLKTASVFAGALGVVRGAADPSYAEKMPAWGPNGKIAFVRGLGGGGLSFSGPTDIMLVDEVGGTASPLNGASANGWTNYYPKYSPDGRWLAYTVSEVQQTTFAALDGRIALVKTDNSGQTERLPLLNDFSFGSSFPTWAVDGSFLSFSSNRPGGQGGWDIYIAPIDMLTGADGPAQNLIEANTNEFEHAAYWSP